MLKIFFKLFFYYAALPLVWLFALLLYLGNNPAPDWANLLPATETLTVWLWRLAAAFTLAALAALLPHRFYRRAADAVINALANFFRLSRPVQVCGAFALSLLLLEGLMLLLPVLQSHWHLDKKFWETGAFWTSAMLLVSAPVAFVVWRFRDENQSKDINLKEFQKISEWVTGAHFPDAEKIKVTGKQKASESSNHTETQATHDKPDTPTQWPNNELGIEFNMPAKSTQALHSFSKQDGAVGLQIAAVYNLLPFYRGDYGQAFEKPSVHLLHSAWQVLQHDILEELKNADDETRKYLIKQLHKRADSPLGQAITRVLLACDHAKKPLLHRHLEILPGICLSGMDFELAGLETEILRDTLFCGQDLTGAQWQGVRGMGEWNLNQAVLNLANLDGVRLNKANLSGAQLYQANLDGAQFHGANLSGVRLYGANLNSVQFNGANLNSAQLDGANLSGAQLNCANLSSAQIDSANLSSLLYRTNLSSSWLGSTNLSGAWLYGVNLLHAQELSAEQLLATKKLAGSLTDADNFSQYAQPEQQQLQEKGLIVLHEGIDTIPEFLVCEHKTEKSWWSNYSANSIPFPIDLAATRAANPDWQISIK